MTNLQKRTAYHQAALKAAVKRKDLQFALVQNYFINEMKLAALLCLIAAWSGSALPRYELFEIENQPYA